MFDSIFKIAKDVTRIAVAPVEIAVDLTRVVTKPIADAAEYVAEEVSDAVDELVGE